MFDGALNVQISGILLKVHYPTLTVMCGVEHTVFFFNDVSKITILHQMTSAHNIKSLVLVYITSLIPFLNQNINIFTIKTLVFLSKTIMEWIDISLGFTETCRY